PRALLLVLDNVEHLLAAAPQLSTVLAGCPRLQILATSRSVLNLSGEHDLPVPPLTLPAAHDAVSPTDAAASAAVHLFLERARAVRPDFRLTETNAATVVAICQRLDGLPLAIELASARIAHLPLDALHRRLEHRLPLLTGGARDLPARLQTMRDAIAWSYDLLTPEEQTLFRRLAVFVGGCTLEAAEAIVEATEAQNDAVLDGIASLVSKSLVQTVEGPGGEPRYQMLETIREYGLEQLVHRGEDVAMRDTHRDWVLAFVKRTIPATLGPGAATWLGRLEPEHDNLRAALAWALARRDGEAAFRLSGTLLSFWYMRGHIGEGRRWLEASLAIGADVPAAHRARALLGLGWFANELGDPERGTAALQESLALYRALGDRFNTGNALDLLGIAAEDHGDYALAEQLMTEALACFEEIGNYHSISQAIYHLGVIAYGQGDLDLAIARYEESQRLARAAGDHFNLANTLWYQGLIHCKRGQLARAADALEEALAMEEALGNLEGAAPTFANFGVLAVAVDRPDVATRLLATAAGAVDRRGVSFCLPERLDYDRALTDVRNRLDEPIFRAAWDAGWTRTIRESASDIDEILAAARSQANLTAPPTPTDGTGLTPRELDVLRLVAQGHSNQQVADALFISVPTVKSHLTNVLGKLRLPSRSAATAYAHTHGLL
ncbi:MAG: tetratricopeptide repeat protein, partial [Chloroflexi bacterium]|nr:tetratricopeptide repeat protein [Chloroflexota bacterium]